MKGALLIALLLSFITSSAVAVSPAPTVTPKPTPVEYVLPYPGILPTHPLYFLKNLRDKIIEVLITDPLRKAEFYILQADKKLQMGVTLKDQQKTPDLAAAAFAQSLAFRERALTELTNYMSTGNTPPGYLTEKFMLSITKHKEVFERSNESTESITVLLSKAQQTLIKLQL